jgi:hypothetical protein
MRANLHFFGALTLPFLACAVASAADEDAQLQEVLNPGMRVRILAPEVFSRKVTGIVDQVSKDAVIIDIPGRNEPVSIAREKIVQLDVSEGARSRGIDAAIGAVIGAGIAAAGCALTNRGQGHLVGTGEVDGVCALFGAGLGATIGVAIPPGERWKKLSASRYRVNLAPRLDHGLDVAVAWRF